MSPVLCHLSIRARTQTVAEGCGKFSHNLPIIIFFIFFRICCNNASQNSICYKVFYHCQQRITRLIELLNLFPNEKNSSHKNYVWNETQGKFEMCYVKYMVNVLKKTYLCKYIMQVQNIIILSWSHKFWKSGQFRI